MRTLISKYACRGRRKRELVEKAALSKIASVVIKNEFRSASYISGKYTIRESNQGAVVINDSYSVKGNDIYDPDGYACARSHLDLGRRNKNGKEKQCHNAICAAIRLRAKIDAYKL